MSDVNERLRRMADELRDILAKGTGEHEPALREIDPGLMAGVQQKLNQAKDIVHGADNAFTNEQRPRFWWLQHPEQIDLHPRERNDIARFFGKPINRDDFLHATGTADDHRLDVKLTNNPEYEEPEFFSP